MKKLITICLLLTSFNVLAESTVIERCISIADLSEVIMDHRQVGTDITVMYTDDVHPLSELLIKEAYSKPRYETEAYRQKAIKDFKNKWFLLCMEANKGDSK